LGKISENSFKFQLGVKPSQSIPDWKLKAARQGRYGKLAKEWVEERDKAFPNSLEEE